LVSVRLEVNAIGYMCVRVRGGEKDGF
jgi:hypothetical protein